MVMDAFEHGKHVVLMNAELDATIGPILQVYARKAGVILVRLRRRPAGGRDQPVPLREGPRAHPPGHGQHQGAAGPLPQPDDAEGLRREVGAEPDDGHQLRRRLEGLVRAGDRRQRDRDEGAEARACSGATTTGTWTSSPRCTTSTCCASSGGIVDYVVGAKPNPGIYCLAEHPDPEASPLPEPVQAGRGAAVQLLHAVAPVPLRGAEHGRARRPVRRRGRDPAGRAAGRGVRVRQEGSPGGRGARRLRHVHDLRRGGELARRCAASATCRRGWSTGCTLKRDIPQGRGADLRRRGAARRVASPTSSAPSSTRTSRRTAPWPPAPGPMRFGCSVRRRRPSRAGGGGPTAAAARPRRPAMEPMAGRRCRGGPGGPGGP